VVVVADAAAEDVVVAADADVASEAAVAVASEAAAALGPAAAARAAWCAQVVQAGGAAAGSVPARSAAAVSHWDVAVIARNGRFGFATARKNL
jgi:hypothetical protein